MHSSVMAFKMGFFANIRHTSLMLSDEIRSVDGVVGLVGGFFLAFAMSNRRFVRFGYAFVCGFGLAGFVGLPVLSNEDIYIP